MSYGPPSAVARASDAPHAWHSSSSAAFSAPQSAQETISGKLQPGQRSSPRDSVPQFGQVIVDTDAPCARSSWRGNRYSNASPSRESRSSA